MLMDIVRTAAAGTLESNDVLVTVSPHDGGIRLTVDSVVMAQFGDDIKACVHEVLSALGVTNAGIDLTDRGAVRPVITARVETALRRAGGTP